MRSGSDRRGLCLVLAAALLYGTSFGQLALLALVLQAAGLTNSATAIVLSTLTVAGMVGRIWSGWVISKIGVTRSLSAGAVTGAASIASLVLIIAGAPVAAIMPLAMVARGIQGISYGVFNSAGICAVKSYAPADQQVYVVGLFTAMFLACNLWATALGELTFRHYGSVVYLALAVVPILLACGLTARLPPVEAEDASSSSGYLPLLRDRRLWLPQAVAFNSGSVYGFATSFLPVVLIEAQVPVTAFFTTFAAALLVNRLVMLQFLQRLPAPFLSAYGLAAFVASVGMLFLPLSVASVMLSGALMGFGSVLHPSAIEWSTGLYPATQSARPVALVNTVMGLGMIAATQSAGLTLQWGRGWVLGFMCIPLLLTLAGVGAHCRHTATRRVEQAIRP
jgi:predicted MFS family arabinose efflux permease